MLNHYFKILRRDLLKNKTYFLLNLVGFTVGMTCFLAALLFVFYELSYEDHQVNKDRIARVATIVTSGDNVTNTALSNTFLFSELPARFAEISSMVRFKRFEGMATVQLHNRENTLSLENVYYCDSGVFKVFTGDFLQGDPNSCLAQPNSVVLTNSVAKRLFGDSSGLNRPLVLSGKTLQVTGIIRDLPGNTDLRPEVLISISTLPDLDNVPWLYTYILFNQSDDVGPFQAKLDKYVKENVNPQMAEESTSVQYLLQPLPTIHFDNRFLYDTPKGNRSLVNIFLVAGILILLAACANSINMTVVKSFSRSMEVAVQKIYGASRGQLITQHVLESVIGGLLASMLAFFLIWLFLPRYAAVINRTLLLSDLINWRMLAAMLASLVVLGVSGAVYTRYYLKYIPLAETLRAKNKGIYKLRVVPRFMLGLQFLVSIGMIIAAITVYRQVSYLKSAPLGFNPRNVIVVELPRSEELDKNKKFFKDLAGENPGVLKTSFCGSTALPGEYTDVDLFEYTEHGIKVKRTVDNIDVDENYLDLLQIPVIKGGPFGSIGDSANKKKNDVIVTALFAQKAGWADPLAQMVGETDMNSQVIGEVADFHFSSLHNPMVPLLIFHDTENPAYLLAKIQPAGAGTTVNLMREAWHKAFQGIPFNYFFLDRHLLEEYRDESNLLSLLLSLSFLVVVVSCIGLIAYTAFIIRIGMADIAIRRVIGASLKDIFAMYLRQFLPLMGISWLLAGPAGWYFLERWLHQFAYHVNPQVTDLVVALAVLLFLVATIILYYTVRSIRINPGRVIRTQ